MKQTNESGGTGQTKRSPWIRSFYLLAAFNVFSVMLALYFSHMLINYDDISVAGNQVWVKRISGFVQLIHLADDVSEPANSLFISCDSQCALLKQREAEVKLEKAFGDVRSEMKAKLDPAKAEPLLKRLNEAVAACNAMSANANTVFTSFDAGKYEQAAQQVAKMNADYSRFSNAVTAMRNGARATQTEEFNQQQSYERVLQNGQYVIAGLVVLMVLGATFFGRKATNQAEAHSRERELHIEKLKNAESQIKEAMEGAEAASRAKSEFLANMSHELRTPLNGVIGMTELLINSSLVGRQMDYALTVRRSAESLLTILNDILDLSKIEAGKMALESIPFDMQSVVEEVGMLMSARASEKSLEMIIRYSPETPRALIGDPVRIRQVLSNIVGNAVKFTQRGHVLIDAQCNSRVNGQAALTLRVEDTGIGIDEAQASKLFQKFSQADASTTRRFGGTGLGLAICKNIVESMHGSIKLESVAGKGSTFIITLTLPEAAEAEAPVRAAAQEGLQNLRFLIVDDNRINRMVLTEQLAGWRLRSVAVESAQDALRELRAAASRGEPYDVALLDYQMPEMDGGKLAATIKAEPEIRSTMLVMLTSMGQHFNAEKMRATGLAALLHKPVRQSVLLETLNKVWAIYTGKYSAGKSGGQLSASRSGAAASVAKPAIDAAGLSKMKVLLVEDNEVNREVAIGMLETLGCQIEVAVDGREGLNRVIREKFDAVLMDCHMPVMDGYEATAEIRRIEQASGGKRIPIIAMTANAMKGDREKCIDCGMDDYASKPIRMSALAGILSKYAPDPKKSAALSNHAQAAVKMETPERPRHQVFDYSAALDTASGKPERLKRIVCAFMADAPRRIDALTNALLSGDRDVAEREAHSLKGAAANLAAERFRSHAFQAECACKSGDLPAAEKIVPMLSQDFNELLKELKPLAC